MSSVLAFERALLLSHEERRYSTNTTANFVHDSCLRFLCLFSLHYSAQELVPFEVVCLALAGVWMWTDNLWLALIHWSTNDPLMVCVCVCVCVYIKTAVCVGLYIDEDLCYIMC